ncbi:MAG: ATP synthase delta/epsilon chain alpha-helix domain-containing protein, partial [Terriglobia bacterium]
YEHSGSTQRMAVSDGFAEVLPGRIIVLARTAERGGEIDVARARSARERAEEQLKRPPDALPEEERTEAQAASERAKARLDAAEMGPSPGI